MLIVTMHTVVSNLVKRTILKISDYKKGNKEKVSNLVKRTILKIGSRQARFTRPSVT